MRRSLLSALTALGAAAVLTGGLGLPAHAGEEADPARGTVKIEDTELGDADNPNEVKVGCDFSLEFFGMEEGTVPVTFTLQPPSGDEVIARDEARVREARGNEHSGSLAVDLTDELATVPPAQAEDYDYKVRVDAEVKETEGNDSIAKSAMLFIVCEAAPATVAGEEAEVAGTEATAVEDEAEVPVGGVSAGLGGGSNGSSGGSRAVLLGGGLLVAGALAAYTRRRQRRA